MPIFNNELTFIHIPKTGGQSIERLLMDNGYKMNLHIFNKDKYINELI